ncbi:MAG: hypothetical protein J5379_04815 [Clostridiales bacterium]|nr:hypothetical protein [Clostridiales bacterium]
MRTLGAKHRTKFLCVCMTVCILLSVLSGCDTYSSPSYEFGKFRVHLNSSDSAKATAAMICEWKWSGDPNDTVIEIPDNYSDKIIIKSVGGYIGTGAPTPFRVVLEDESRLFTSYYHSQTAGTDVLFKDDPHRFGVKRDAVYEIVDLEFTMKLGKNVQQVYISFIGRERNPEMSYIGIINDDGSITFYRIFFRFECDPENKTYYAEDGVLYEKKTNARPEKVQDVYLE